MAGTFSSSTQPAKQFVKAFIHSSEPISRATSPGLACGEHEQEDNKKRYRPRTFDYFRLLPFPVEDESYRDAALNRLLKNLYISIMAEDFAPGALHWTRELTGWLNLKFEMTRELRARLTQLYYHLALAPGLDGNTADRFAKMVITLTRLAINASWIRIPDALIPQQHYLSQTFPSGSVNADDVGCMQKKALFKAG